LVPPRLAEQERAMRRGFLGSIAALAAGAGAAFAQAPMPVAPAGAPPAAIGGSGGVVPAPGPVPPVLPPPSRGPPPRPLRPGRPPRRPAGSGPAAHPRPPPCADVPASGSVHGPAVPTAPTSGGRRRRWLRRLRSGPALVVHRRIHAGVRHAAADYVPAVDHQF